MKLTNSIKFINENYMLKVFILASSIATVIFLPFILLNDGIFLHYSDYIQQQIPFYQLCHESIRSGEFGFNLFTDSGVDFIGSYSFYTLGSPFFWLTIPFPNNWLPYLMGPLLILKFGCIALTASVYIKMFVKNPNLAVIGGILYAFCGFNMYNIVYNHFHDVVVFFPLLLISMEKFIREDKKYFFAISVCICCILNYYFFFGQVIFCIIYFFVRINYDDFNVDIKKFSLLALEAVLGLLMACFLLIPSLMALTGDSRAQRYISFSDWFLYKEINWYLLYIANLFFPPSSPGIFYMLRYQDAVWSSPTIYIPLFNMVGVITFFKYKKKHFIKPLLTICLVMSVIPVLNASFSAFNTLYYARWYYMPTLIIILATMIVLEENFDNLKFGLKLTGIFSILVFIMVAMPQRKTNGDLKWFFNSEKPDVFVQYCLLVLISLLFVFFIIEMGKKDSKIYSKIMSIASVLIIFNGLYLMSFSILNNNFIPQTTKLNLKREESLSEEFYRVSTVSYYTNLGMYLRLPSITSFHSIISPSMKEYYEAIGGSREHNGSLPSQGDEGINASTNVKYVVINDEYMINFNDYTNSDIYVGLTHQGMYGEYMILENDYFVPFGVGYDYQVTQSQFDDTLEYKSRILLGGLYLGYDENGVEYDLLPAMEIDSQDFHLSDEQYLINCENLASNSIQNLYLDSYGFTGTYETDRKQLLYISLPHSTGFSATINGEPVDILKANFGFMAVPVEAGINQVEFKYVTPGLELGVKISIFALFVFFIYILCTTRKKEHLTNSKELEDVGLNLDNNINKDSIVLNLESEIEIPIDEDYILEENDNDINIEE